MISFVTNMYIFAVRGMMYYRRALKLQAFLDMAKESGKMNNFLDYVDVSNQNNMGPCRIKMSAKHVSYILEY